MFLMEKSWDIGFGLVVVVVFGVVVVVGVVGVGGGVVVDIVK